MAAGVKRTANRTGRKNMIIGTVSLGGSPAAFFSASVAALFLLLFATFSQSKALSLRRAPGGDGVRGAGVDENEDRKRSAG